MLGEFIQVHLVLFGEVLAGATRSVVTVACRCAACCIELWLVLLILLLELVFELLQPFKPFVHVHILRSGILGLVEAAEILL